MSTAADSRPRRVAILTPTGKDAALTAATLKDAGIDSVTCRDLAEVDRVLREGAGALLVAEEALFNGGMKALATTIATQGSWSDIPVLLLTRQGADSATVAKALEALGNVALLERPVRPSALLSSVRASLKARDRQYEVRDYLAEQQRAQDMLRDADRRKDEFIATLAHELRNPLAPIRNSLHILRMSAGDDPAAAQVCEMMERQVGNLVRLVDDLMEVSRITRGKIELRTERVELAAVIRSAVEISKPLIESLRHRLAISIPPDPLTVDGDPVRLSQVVANLLNNSAKYMDEGGQIRLQVRGAGNSVQISIRDSGIGIPPEMLPHIFTMFTQVDRSARQAQGGLGIGLTLVRTLVEMHGGRVEALSEGVGRGSEFVVTLPLIAGNAAMPRSSRPTAAATLPRHRVLVVDDNLDGARSLGLLLKLLGSEVAVVNDGPAALETYGTFGPTVVLLDIGMPGMDGYEVARRLRSASRRRQTAAHRTDRLGPRRRQAPHQRRGIRSPPAQAGGHGLAAVDFSRVVATARRRTLIADGDSFRRTARRRRQVNFRPPSQARSVCPGQCSGSRGRPKVDWRSADGFGRMRNAPLRANSHRLQHPALHDRRRAA
ncbi:MAG: hybrid sensor histidine kinase/response regulator [Pirellulales bacterium]